MEVTKVNDSLRQQLDWNRMNVIGGLGDPRIILGNQVFKATGTKGDTGLWATFGSVAFLAFLGDVAILVFHRFEWAPFLIVLAFVIVFGLVSFGAAWICRPFILDKPLGLYYRGSRAANGRPPAQQGRLSEICAIQVVFENAISTTTDDRGRERTTTSIACEVNLIRCDGIRVNALNHTNVEANEKAAAQIAAFLNLPIWHRYT